MSPFKRIHSLVIAAATSLAVMGGVTSAQAAVVTFNFGTMAISNEGPFTSATVDGITLKATAFGNGYSTPYLDDFFNSMPGGLGVCSSGFESDGQCKNSADDNVSLTPGSSPVAESLKLEFFSDVAMDNPLSVIINPTFFRNSQHETNFSDSAMIDIAVNSGAYMAYPLIADFITPLGPGDTFYFRYNNAEFYIESLTVPLPAALPLFLSALAGLALVGRRQRKKASG